MVLVAVGHTERVQALACAAGCDVRRAVIAWVDRRADRLDSGRRAATDRIRPLVDVVVAIDDQIDVVLVEQWRPELAHTALGAVRSARAVAAVMEEHNDEAD